MVKFNIKNITKFPYFLKEGMKPLVFSELNRNVGWTNKTSKVQLFKNVSNQLEDNLNDKKQNSYTLSFSYKFKHNNDKVYFAFWQPYSYTKLQELLQKFESILTKEATGICKPLEAKRQISVISSEIEIETNEIYYKREQLCSSVGGVPIYLLTITSSTQQIEDPYHQRSYVIITSRAHAGETAGSYKTEGMIKFLLGKDPMAVLLRQQYIFLIVPMLNPDGVILGHNRCCLNGCDLNRCWNEPNQETQPSIFYVKSLFNELYLSRKEISLYCDLHGHSRKLSSFMFGCNADIDKDKIPWIKIRLFPRILARKCHIFNYSQCQFTVEPDKVYYSLIQASITQHE